MEDKIKFLPICSLEGRNYYDETLRLAKLHCYKIPEMPSAFFLTKPATRHHTHSFSLQELEAVVLVWRQALFLEQRERERERERERGGGGG